VRERLVVLGLGQRVDRAELLAAALQALDARRAGRRPSRVQRLGGGSASSPSARASASSSVAASARRRAPAGRGPRRGDRVAALAQAAWISASSAAHARSAAATPSPASRSAAARRRAPRRAPRRLQRAASAATRRSARAQRAVATRRRQALDPRARSARSRRGALGHAALGGELALDLGAAHGRLALLGRLAALVDEPRRAALLLAAARGRGRRRARAVGLVARRVGAGDRAAGGLDAASAACSACTAASDSRDERVAAVALGEHALRPPRGAWRSSRVKPNHARPRA
jgi:hypothetical protein